MEMDFISQSPYESRIDNPAKRRHKEQSEPTEVLLPPTIQPKVLPVIVVFAKSEKPFCNWKIEERKSVLRVLELEYPDSSFHVDAGGDLFVYPATLAQKENLLARATIAGQQVQIQVSNRETELQRLIEGVAIGECTSDIERELQPYGVTSVKRLTVTKEGISMPTETVILTFSREPPEHVDLAGVNFPLRKLKWRPLQCKKCWLLGHTARRCRNRQRCPRCSSPTCSDASCQANPLCINCKQTHASTDKICPAYRHRQRILDVAQKYNISFNEAKLKLALTPLATTRKLTVAPMSPLPSPRFSHDTTDPTILTQELKELKIHIVNLQKQVEPLEQISRTVSELQQKAAANDQKFDELNTCVSEIKPVIESLMPNVPMLQYICNTVRRQLLEDSATSPDQAHSPANPPLPLLDLFSHN